VHFRRKQFICASLQETYWLCFILKRLWRSFDHSFRHEKFVTDGHQNCRYRGWVNCSRELPSRWQIRSPQLPMVVKIIFTTHWLRVAKTLKGQS